MKKHTLVHLIFTVALLSVCSCSSLKKFGEEKKFLYKTVNITTNEEVYNDFDVVLYVLNNKESCFKEPVTGDVITVRFESLETALNYFYRNKATWHIKEVKEKYKTDLTMKAVNQMNLQYEVAYCNFRYLGAFEEWHTYASFRLVNQ